MSDGADPSELLRQRVVEIARRRVPSSVVEQVVEVALPGDGAEGGLRSTLLRLRGAIADYFAEQDRSPRLEAWDPTSAPIPAESLDEEALARACRSALRDLGEESPTVTRYLRQLGAGLDPIEVAQRARISPELLYQRIYRGREQLDRRLVARGVRT